MWRQRSQGLQWVIFFGVCLWTLPLACSGPEEQTVVLDVLRFVLVALVLTDFFLVVLLAALVTFGFDSGVVGFDTMDDFGIGALRSDTSWSSLKGMWQRL